MPLSATHRSGGGRKLSCSARPAQFAVVAFANKPARIAWAALRREERFAATGTPMAA